MKDQTRKPQASPSENSLDSKLDLDALLHPARAFAHPMDVVRDADLTLSEKRAILASWASDACALEAAPDLRVTTSGRVVSWDDIMDALRTLDREAMAFANHSRITSGCWPARSAGSPSTIHGRVAPTDLGPWRISPPSR